MIYYLFAILLLATQIECNSNTNTAASPVLLYSWKFLNYTFRTSYEYEEYIQNNYYKNCMLAGVKIAPDGTTFVSVPRWKPGVPATFAKVVDVHDESANFTLLQPYPSWEHNKEGNPNALQSVLGFEIDPKNRLWILDQGKVNGNPAIPNSIKLWIWDITTNKLIQSYTFSENEAPLDSSFLNDLVLDLQNQFAYITDSGIGTNPLHGGLLVYDFKRNVARRVLNQVASTQPDPSVWIVINNEKVLESSPMETGADGIALSPSTKTLYWCPLTGRSVFSIETKFLRNWTMSDAELQSQVQFVMNKKTASDGLSCSNEGDDILYITSLEQNGIIRTQFNQNFVFIAQDDTTMVWPDTIGWDHKGSIVFVSNRLHWFVQDKMDFSDTNFRIWSVFVNANSYLDP